MEIQVPISPGELIDKITILEIKSQRMSDARKLANVRAERDLLLATWKASAYSAQNIEAEWAQLRSINEKLWVIEDDIREQERAGSFGEEFIRLARAVYFINDDRAAVKRLINEKLGSTIREEKSYADYKKG
jgi:hypothetical protein